ncbi:MAG TPA: MauE/DoxX family redox-associated membrane protein, partial [Blastocatellia bacterium]|nr:MauE/DoxX family redox-associated membrane protein [Blastocatellia bacterium]
MGLLLLIARLLLSVIFGVAGVTKAIDLAGSRRTVADFGVPEKLAAVLGAVLPFIEILVALALLPLGTAWVAAGGALALLLVFSIGIAVNLARGNSPDCHCFGQLHS